MMLREIELQQKVQREYFELFIREILKAFGCSHQPAPYYSLKILFEEPISLLAIVERAFEIYEEGPIPVSLEATGITISAHPADMNGCLDHLCLEARIEEEEDPILISLWKRRHKPLNSRDPIPPPSEIETHPPPVCYYLFTKKVLHQILEALKENAAKKSQLREEAIPPYQS